MITAPGICQIFADLFLFPAHRESILVEVNFFVIQVKPVYTNFNLCPYLINRVYLSLPGGFSDFAKFFRFC